MTRRINLSMGEVWRCYYTLEVQIDGKNVSCKKERIFYGEREKHLKIFAEKDLIPVEVSDDQLVELDTFNIFSWQKEYIDFSMGTDGIW